MRPAVETDILRLWSDTSAWHNRLQDTGQPAPCHTLFDVKTFTTKQIMADPRVRFEQQVREAGLLTTEYARQALAHLPPLQPPRRDTQSTVFRKWGSTLRFFINDLRHFDPFAIEHRPIIGCMLQFVNFPFWLSIFVWCTWLFGFTFALY